MSENSKVRKVTVSLPFKQVEELDAWADSRGFTRTMAMAIILEQFFNSMKSMDSLSTVQKVINLQDDK